MSNVTATAASAATARPAWTLARQVLVAALVLPTPVLVLLFGPVLLTVPPVVGFMALELLCASLVAWRNPKWAALAGGVVAALFAGMNLPFLGPALFRPDHGMNFVAANFAVVMGVVGLAAGVAAFREARRAPVAANWGAPGAVAVLLAAGLVLGIAFAGTAARFAPVTGAGAVVLAPDATAEVTLEDFRFPEGLAIPAGKVVKLTVHNRDSELHTFTVDALGLDAEIPAGKSVDVWLQAEAGTYEVYCAPHAEAEADGTHEGMAGTLVVQ